ncbi:hypothetical protein TL16_g08273 [Triparma laevis f. inornata]|uniref:Uncharacterized protein n=1 Tax=Triparma laevis f. inornata TaxID=1714386 RepID=A0A9W7AXG3_9STRA|nr:hypothetical protein TL16_g08273 [Triparma laevis f. inornata]
MHATKDDKLVKVLKRNLTACGLTMSTSLVTLLGCTMCGPEEKHKSAVMFVASWVAFDKWTDVHAINVAFDDFSDFAMCGEGAKVKPDGTGSEEGGSTEASGASEEEKT